MAPSPPAPRGCPCPSRGYSQGRNRSAAAASSSQGTSVSAIAPGAAEGSAPNCRRQLRRPAPSVTAGRSRGLRGRAWYRRCLWCPPPPPPAAVGPSVSPPMVRPVPLRLPGAPAPAAPWSRHRPRRHPLLPSPKCCGWCGADENRRTCGTPSRRPRGPAPPPPAKPWESCPGQPLPEYPRAQHGSGDR